MEEQEIRITNARRPDIEKLFQFLEAPHEELLPLAARLFLVPENPSRQAYTVLRKIYLAAVDDWRNIVFDFGQYGSKEHLAQLNDKMDKKYEIESWLRPPLQPLSLEQAAKLIEGAKSEFWRQSVLRQAGKRHRAGQPASKRHLALRALDIKCAYPEMSLREVTDILCPCGKDNHISQCREQLRQQINRLVKLFRTHGYDFTWEKIKTEGWKVLSEYFPPL